MKALKPKAVYVVGFLSAIIASGLVYAATVSTVTNQTINSGDIIGQGWYQTVNDKVNNLTLGGTCSISEYQMRYQGCPAGSAPYRIDNTCGEGSCVGSLSNGCRYMDGSHVGQTDSTACYAATLASTYDYCSGSDKITVQVYTDWSTQQTNNGYDASCDNGGGG